VELQAGEHSELTVVMRARPNWRMGSQRERPLYWSVRKGSPEMKTSRYDSEFINDDYMSYIDQRRAHPYGGRRNTMPHFYHTVECAPQ